MTVVDFPTQQQQPQMGNAASARHNRPNLEFIEATDGTLSQSPSS